MSLFSAQRQAVIAEAKTWLGTPWAHNEAVKHKGVDCGQFPLSVYRSLDLIDHDPVDDYPVDWALHRDHERYLEIVERYCVPVDAPQSGDIVVFKFGRSFSHGAIVLEYPLIIHALRGEKAGVVLDHARQGELKRRERQFYSYFAKQALVLSGVEA